MTFTVQLRDAWAVTLEVRGWVYRNPIGGWFGPYSTELTAAEQMSAERKWLARNPQATPAGGTPPEHYACRSKL